ncbi:hypothetical protein FB472_1853 [Rhodoglobus vestalii]|uniref:Uncharacterized protein n=1 Tax=Rhodoglobus vestalii TaxID=193384 RepID=A0A8H2K5J8_9MICO|nr:hypothetical protein [Rhodoglobus vestalii]TQO20233.1 hypothetical protein FB472_1853 [Rhodoglobus vestalii]
MLPTIDRWNDCGRLPSDLDLAAVGSLALGAGALASWFWLRFLIPAKRPEVLGLATTTMVTVLVIAAIPLQISSAGRGTRRVERSAKLAR